MEMVSEKVIACVAHSLIKNPKDLNIKTKIISELGADSLDFMDIIFQLETAFALRLQKEDFDFIVRSGLTREQALVDGQLSPEAKKGLAPWIPDLPVEQQLEPKDLAKYLSIESLCLVVEDKLKGKE